MGTAGIVSPEIRAQKSGLRPVASILIFAAVLGLAFALLSPLQRLLFERMTVLRDSYIAQTEAYLGRSIRYASMSPNFLNTIDIRDIRIQGAEGPPVLQIDRLRVSFSLAGLLAGNYLKAISLVVIDKPEVNFDFQRDGDLLDLFSGGEGGGSLLEDLPPSIVLELHKGRAAITSPGSSALAENINLMAVIDGKRIEATVDSPVLSVETDSLEEFRKIFQGGEKEAGETPALRQPPVDIAVELRNADLSFTSPDDTARLENLSLSGEIAGERLIVNGNWKGEGHFHDDNIGGFRMEGRLDGDIGLDFQTGALSLELPVLEADNFACQPFSLVLDLSPESYALGLVHNRMLFGVRVKFDRETGEIAGVFEGKDFLLSDFLTLRGKWKEYNSYLTLQLSGNAGLSLLTNQEQGYSLRAYSFNLTGIPRYPQLNDLSFAIRGGGDLRQLRLASLEIDSPRADLGFSGQIDFGSAEALGRIFSGAFDFSGIEVNGALSARRLRVYGEKEISGDLSVSTFDGLYNFFSERVLIGDMTLSAFEGEARVQEDGVLFSASALHYREPELNEDLKISNVNVEGSYDFQPSRLVTTLSVESFVLSDMVELVRPFVPNLEIPELVAGPAKNLTVTTEVFVDTDFEHISYNLPRFISAYDGGQDVFAIFSIKGTDLRFEVSDGRVIWSDGIGSSSGIEASGAFDFTDFQDISFSLQTSYKDLTYYFNGMIRDQRDLSLQGSYGLDCRILATGGGRYEGSLDAEGIPVPLGEQTGRISLGSSFRWDGKDSWSIEIPSLEAQNLLPASFGASEIVVQAKASEKGLELPRFFIDDGRGALEGNMNITWQNWSMFDPIGEDAVFSGEISAADRSGIEHYLGACSYSPGGLHAELQGAKMQLARFLGASRGYDPVVTGKVALDWKNWEDFSADIDLASLDARFGENPVSLSMQGHLDQVELSLQNLKADYAGFRASIPALKASRVDGFLEGSADVSGPFLGRNMALTFDALGSFESQASWLELPKAAEGFNASILVKRARLDEIESSRPFSLSFYTQDEAYFLNGGPDECLRFEYTPKTEKFFLVLSQPSPVSGSVEGTYSAKDGTVDARTENMHAYLYESWRILSKGKGFYFSGGYLDAKIHLTGPLSDPAFEGTVQGTDVRMTVPDVLAAEIGPSPIPLVFEGNTLSFGPVDTVSGGGKAAAKGIFYFENWAPSSFDIDVAIPAAAPVPFKLNIANVASEGKASGRIGLHMRDWNLSVDGSLTAEDTILTIRKREEAAEGGGGGNLVVDMQVTTGRKVEFMWPSEDDPIIQANADIGQMVHFTSDAAAGVFSINGDVSLRSGEVFYFQRSFYLREGLLTLNGNQEKFDPIISARAEVRDRNEDGPVTISIIADNTPLKDIQTGTDTSTTPYTGSADYGERILGPLRIESEPALSSVEIYSLLGQNLTGESSDGGVDFIFAPLEYISQARWVRVVERWVRNILDLDVFSLRSPLIRNATKEAMQIFNSSDSNDTSLGKYLDNTTIFVGKYIGTSLFLQAMVSLRYDSNSAEEFSRGLTLEPDFGVELRNPLFTLRLNVVPEHPENLWINDVSFTMNWRWTF